MAMLCSVASMAIAQVPSGTRIENQARGEFRFKTGARDSVRSNTVQTVVSSTEGPFLFLEKSVDLASVAPGTNLTYTLRLTNQGTSAATSLRLVDSLPANTTLVSASDAGVRQGSIILWEIPNLPASAERTVQLVVRVSPALLNGTITNRARVSCQQGISAASNLVESTVTTYIANSLKLVATKDAIIGNGSDTTTLGAIVLDAAGVRATDGTMVRFTTTRGSFANGTDTITAATVGGTASVTLRSVVVVNETVVAAITATSVNASGQTLLDSGAITFYSGAIAGTVFSTSSNAPIVGADAFAYDGTGVEVSRDTTDSAGYYLLPVPGRGEYEVLIRYTNRHGRVIETRSVVGVDAPAGAGGSAPTPATSSIAGTVVDDRTGEPLEGDSIQVTIESQGFGKRSGDPVGLRSVLTDAQGGFVFDSLALGRYRLRVVSDQYQGWMDIVDTVPGLMVIDSDIEVSEIPRLQLALTATKRVADIGDVVGYTIAMTNSSRSVHLDSIVLSSALPPGFAYVAGTSRLGTTAIADPSGSHILQWRLGDTLASGSALKITYRAIAGAGSIDGDGTTRAFATATSLSGDSALSAAVELAVDIRSGLFTDRGIVIGKIYYDADSNGYQDPGEDGIPGVELWMEDGTRVVTGEDGLYSLPQIAPGERVIRVNRGTLPTGSILHSSGTAFAGDALSRFVRISEGGIARADFHVLPPTQGALGFSASRPRIDAIGDTATVLFVIRTDDPTKTKGILLSDTLPAGLHYDLTTLKVNGVLLRSEARRSRILAVQLQSLVRGTSDSVTVSIVADSAGVSQPIGNRGVLILSYPKGRDTHFHPPASGLQGWVPPYEPRRWFAVEGVGRTRMGGRS
jgi:uncharacterized repeat protein (TIGR01451 family)